MHIIRIIAAILLIAEFVMAPINLWTGHTMDNFKRFTGLPVWVAQRIFAPVKLIGAIALIIGFFIHACAIIGAIILAIVCAAYIVLLCGKGRRDTSGFTAFGFGLVCALVVALT